MHSSSHSTDVPIASGDWIKLTASRLFASAAVACSVALTACTSLPRTPYTAAEASTSRVLDIDGLRRYADEPITKFSFEKSITPRAEPIWRSPAAAPTALMALAC